MFRTCVAEAARFPELGQAFYQNGPEMGRARMVVYLKLAIERGQLHDVDPDMIAEQFSELCRARLWSRAIFGVQTSFSEAEINEVANHAVETVLARFAV